MRQTCFSLAASLVAAASPVLADGFLASKPEQLPALEIGLGDAGFGVSQKSYSLSTGKGYSLKIRSTGKQPCPWVAPELSNSIWVRKVEVNKVEIKVPTFYEIEMEDEGEAELVFVPIRPGEYTWRCKGLEEKGVTGKFIVK